MHNWLCCVELLTMIGITLIALNFNAVFELFKGLIVIIDVGFQKNMSR